MATVTVTKDDAGNIAVRFRYDPALIAKIKTIPGYRWDQTAKYWTFPNSDQVLSRLISVFAVERLEIDQELQAALPTEAQTEETTTDTIIDQVRHLIRLKHYSIRTEDTYLHWISRYLSFHNNRNPQLQTSEDIEAFLSYLAVDQKVSAGTQNVAFNAILFLYKVVLRKDLGNSINAIRAKKPVRLPTVMTKDETMRVIGAVPPDYQLLVKLIYGSGLRLMECLRLRVKDIDFENNHILIRDAKGMKDRVTVLPDNLKSSLRDHLERVKLIHEDDTARGYGKVHLPYALERKYPKASIEWGWQFAFPAKSLSKDPRTGIIRRHHLHENGLQKAVQSAVRLAGIIKPVNVHTFRHCFATHLLEANYDIRTVQELLGHKDVSTTMIYTHVLNRPGIHVKSPIDD